jgi:hypothetical protein
VAAILDNLNLVLQGGINLGSGPYNIGLRIRGDGAGAGELTYRYYHARGAYNPVTDEWSSALGVGRSFGAFDTQLSRQGYFVGVGLDQNGMFVQFTGTINLPLGNSTTTPWFSGLRLDKKFPVASYDDIKKFVSPLQNLLHDPLVLDLDGDGVEVSSLVGSSVHFDYGGDGFRELTGWVSADDGILAIDDNGNGIVDNGLELFVVTVTVH